MSCGPVLAQVGNLGLQVWPGQLWRGWQWVLAGWDGWGLCQGLPAVLRRGLCVPVPGRTSCEGMRCLSCPMCPIPGPSCPARLLGIVRQHCRPSGDGQSRCHCQSLAAPRGACATVFPPPPHRLSPQGPSQRGGGLSSRSLPEPHSHPKAPQPPQVSHRPPNPAAVPPAAPACLIWSTSSAFPFPPGKPHSPCDCSLHGCSPGRRWERDQGRPGPQ